MLVNEDILLGVNKESCNDQLRLDKKKKKLRKQTSSNNKLHKPPTNHGFSYCY
jgi:hypothetical protein